MPPQAVTSTLIRAAGLLGPLQLLACFLQGRQRPGSSQPEGPQKALRLGSNAQVSPCPRHRCPVDTFPWEPFWPWNTPIRGIPALPCPALVTTAGHTERRNYLRFGKMSLHRDSFWLYWRHHGMTGQLRTGYSLNRILVMHEHHASVKQGSEQGAVCC